MKQVNQWEGTILSHYLKLMLSEFGLLNLQTITKGFSHSSVGQESACNAGDPSWIPGWGRSAGEGKGYPLQYSGLEISMDHIVHQFSSVQSLSHLQLCDPTDYTVPVILQARILEWVAFPFSSRSSWPRNQPWVSCIAGGFFTNWAVKEAQTLL